MESQIKIIVVATCLVKHSKPLPFDITLESLHPSTRINILIDKWQHALQAGVVRGSNRLIQLVIYLQIVRIFHTSFCVSSLEEGAPAVNGYYAILAWSRGSALPVTGCLRALVEQLEVAAGSRGSVFPVSRRLYALAGSSELAVGWGASAEAVARCMDALVGTLNDALPATGCVHTLARSLGVAAGSRGSVLSVSQYSYALAESLEATAASSCSVIRASHCS